MQIQLDPGTIKYLNNKCWDRLLDHFFNVYSKGEKVSTIKMSYIYKIIVIVFESKKEKLLINLV